MSTKRKQIYRCDVCGNVVEVLAESFGILSCCNQEMKLFEENTMDAAKEKHVPVIEETGNGYKVTVGSVAHPMEEKHYIQFIQLIVDGQEYTALLNPGDKPEAYFPGCSGKDITAREFCNVHGLWKK